MSQIKLYTRNILEDGTVTVTGDADTGYPESRLYDRDISFFWKYTAVGAIEIHVDQGATTNESVDALFIPKHNFSGEDMTWQYSDDDAGWTPAVAGWNQGDNNAIEKLLSSAVTARYWKITVSSMSNPQCSEIFMSYGYAFNFTFTNTPVFGGQPNVVWTETVGGLERSTKLGNERRTRAYTVFLREAESELTNWRAAMADLDEYSLPFYFKDHEANYFMARLLERPPEPYMTEGHLEVSISVIEKL